MLRDLMREILDEDGWQFRMGNRPGPTEQQAELMVGRLLDDAMAEDLQDEKGMTRPYPAVARAVQGVRRAYQRYGIGSAQMIAATNTLELEADNVSWRETQGLAETLVMANERATSTKSSDDTLAYLKDLLANLQGVRQELQVEYRGMSSGDYQRMIDESNRESADRGRAVSDKMDREMRRPPESSKKSTDADGWQFRGSGAGAPLPSKTSALSTLQRALGDVPRPALGANTPADTTRTAQELAIIFGERGVGASNQRVMNAIDALYGPAVSGRLTDFLRRQGLKSAGMEDLLTTAIALSER